MTELTNVRTACWEDEEGIMSLLRMMHRENGVFSLNEDKVRGVVRRGLDRDRSLIGVIGPIAEPVACVGIAIGDTWYSDDPSMGDLFMFVHPDHRKSRHAHELLQFTKKCSDELGIPMTMGIFGGSDNEGKILLYKKKFGPMAGAYFIYNGKAGAA